MLTICGRNIKALFFLLLHNFYIFQIVYSEYVICIIRKIMFLKI